MRASLPSLGLLLVMVMAGAPAGAEEAKPDYAAAKRHFKNGQQLLQIARHAEAMGRHRTDVLSSIQRLEEQQDDLLDRLNEAVG
jgi:hypothetical protein